MSKIILAALFCNRVQFNRVQWCSNSSVGYECQMQCAYAYPIEHHVSALASDLSIACL